MSNQLTNESVIGVENLLADQCAGSVACCQKSDSEAVSYPSEGNMLELMIL